MFERRLVFRCCRTVVKVGFWEEDRWLEALKNLVGERGFEPLTPCL